MVLTPNQMNPDKWIHRKCVSVFIPFNVNNLSVLFYMLVTKAPKCVCANVQYLHDTTGSKILFIDPQRDISWSGGGEEGT